jgi:hypothetical protein
MMTDMISKFLAVTAMAVVAFSLGCAHPDRESDLPWNTPQAWEGSPFIPGMEGR